MIVIPAIDLLGGACVRLRHGDYGQKTSYADDPPAVARSFEAAGARWIHIVDLDAARRPAGTREGSARGSNNRAVVKAIRSAVGCRIQTGGGIRTAEDVEELLACGVNRLVLGTVLVHDPDEVARWRARFGPVFVAGIDAVDGRVKVAGWTVEGGMPDLELARRCAGLGMRGIVYTNIARDGTLGGPDLERTGLVARDAGLPTIVSGGVGSMSDLEAAAARFGVDGRHGVAGLIVGKAMYEGRLDLAEALRRFQEERDIW